MINSNQINLVTCGVVGAGAGGVAVVGIRYLIGWNFSGINCEKTYTLTPRFQSDLTKLLLPRDVTSRRPGDNQQKRYNC